MIMGRFDEHGRPSIDGLVSFPPVQRLRGKVQLIPITFVIDTGADRTLILPAHYEPYHYADFRGFALDYPGGYGGTIEVRKVLPTFLHFRHHDGAFVRITAEIEVARPSRALEGYPSVLGRHVLDFYRLVVNKPAAEVYLDVG
jgi:hypothetical protein